MYDAPLKQVPQQSEDEVTGKTKCLYGKFVLTNDRLVSNSMLKLTERVPLPSRRDKRPINSLYFKLTENDLTPI